MLKKIESKEIMTIRAATDKYRTQYFDMVITDYVDGCDNDLGYVIYVSEDERDMLNVPRNEFNGIKVAHLFGDGTEPYPSIGNVVYHA
jgi:hypothetical protein